YLGNGGNLKLARNIFNWLLEQDEILKLDTAKANDIRLEIGTTGLALMAWIYMLVLPLLLLLSGIVIWYRRRQR
ncbi:MAG: ABC transporter, partial [Gammaproteobacteria bacterium]|nr:ABC transporter [Gammaproteobacteria bacterium]